MASGLLFIIVILFLVPVAADIPLLSATFGLRIKLVIGKMPPKLLPSYFCKLLNTSGSLFASVYC